MSGSRNNFQFLNNPLAIRQEIQRFESVHPSIYAIYDLIELIADQQIAQQIRDHVVCIEGKYQLTLHSRLCECIGNVNFTWKKCVSKSLKNEMFT